jgi:sugar phosphate isomerase/epimerase
VTRRELIVATAAWTGAACVSTVWARSRWDRSRISAITDELGNTPDEAVAFAREYGLQFVEIRNQPGTNKEYATLREADIQADAAHLVNEGIKVSCVNTSLFRFAWPGDEPAAATPEEPDQREKRLASGQARWDRRLEDLRKALRCAQIMGADKVRIFAGTRTATARADGASAMLQRTAGAIGEMALVAEKEKICLLLENDAATNAATSAELAGVMKLAPSKWLAIGWNPHNARALEKPFPDGYAALPRKRILNVRAQAGGLMPGRADTEDWKALLLALDRDGYNGKIALETGVLDGSRSAAARASLDQLVHIVREVS